MARRVFYVVYFEDKDLQRMLDAIRLVCEPGEKTQAHITIRGPYSQRYNLSAQQERIRGSRIAADGVDHFFNEGQSTVFIKCNSHELREAWKKSDFGFNPHITLYDGSSRTFATCLLQLLSGLNLSFPFVANGLFPLVSRKGQNTIELRAAYDEHFVSGLLGNRLLLSDIDELDTKDRLSIVETIAKHLPARISQED